MTVEDYNPQKPPKTCPDCHKKGVKKKVKMFMINLDDEGVFMCEDPSCPWPLNVKSAQNYDVKLN